MADLKIIVTVPEAKSVAFVEGFLGFSPKGNAYAGSDIEWVQHSFEMYAQDAYERGVQENAVRNAVVDLDILAE